MAKVWGDSFSIIERDLLPSAFSQTGNTAVWVCSSSLSSLPHPSPSSSSSYSFSCSVYFLLFSTRSLKQLSKRSNTYMGEPYLFLQGMSSPKRSIKWTSSGSTIPELLRQAPHHQLGSMLVLAEFTSLEISELLRSSWFRRPFTKTYKGACYSLYILSSKSNLTLPYDDTCLLLCKWLF